MEWIRNGIAPHRCGKAKKSQAKELHCNAMEEFGVESISKGIG